MLTVTNVNKYTSQELEQHIRVLQAELDSRKSATHEDVYTRAGVSEGNEEMFDDVVYAICEENLTITEVSTPDRAGYITGNAKNWVRNLGGLRAFREMHNARGWEHTYPTIEIQTQTTSVPESICKAYLESRAKAGNGFTTKMTMVEVGTYKGNPFGIVQKPNGARWVIGDVTKLGRVVAVSMTRKPYKNVDKETKGQRMVCEIPVFDPQG